ncbi:hypothetical protein ACIQWV_38720 [Streptomyces sp. NPDC098085]|uniref:hypothetical protein n=1 Tax=Streptomyces sp. NPDC098085 TaxID=3366094 RepID=UPI0037F2AAAD
MTEWIDETPENPQNRPDFLLWHPLCIASQSGYTCTFDVTAEEFEEISHGTDELITAFAERLDIDANGITDWKIERFLSPYYSFEVRPEQRPFGLVLPTTGDWADRFGLAWRTTLWFTSAMAPFRYRGLGPYPVIGHDNTWPYQSSINGSCAQEETVIVIADCWGVEDWSFLDEFSTRHQVDLICIPAQLDNFTQARIQLESVQPVAVEDSVVDFLKAFTVRLFSTHRKTTEEMGFWPPPLMTDEGTI